MPIIYKRNQVVTCKKYTPSFSFNSSLGNYKKEKKKLKDISFLLWPQTHSILDQNGVMTFKPFFTKLKDVAFKGVFVFSQGFNQHC